MPTGMSQANHNSSSEQTGDDPRNKTQVPTPDHDRKSNLIIFVIKMQLYMVHNNISETVRTSRMHSVDSCVTADHIRELETWEVQYGV